MSVAPMAALAVKKRANVYFVMVELKACGEWKWGVRKIGEQRFLS